jgi:hypothetical protein
MYVAPELSVIRDQATLAFLAGPYGLPPREPAWMLCLKHDTRALRERPSRAQRIC